MGFLDEYSKKSAIYTHILENVQLIIFELPVGGTVFEDKTQVQQNTNKKDEKESKTDNKLEGTGKRKVNKNTITATNNNTTTNNTTNNNINNTDSNTKKREPLEYHSAPLIRVIGYDPRTKKSSILEVSTDAVTEVAGGGYSQYLEPARRKELAKIIVDALAVHFPRGGGFDLILPWSGSKVKASNVQASTKASWRSSAEKILRRTGKIFRSAIRISSYKPSTVNSTPYSQTLNSKIQP